MLGTECTISQEMISVLEVSLSASCVDQNAIYMRARVASIAFNALVPRTVLGTK